MPHRHPIVLAKERFAAVRLYLELDEIIREFLQERNAPNDPDLQLVFAGVCLGHADGHPFNLTKLANHLHFSRETMKRKLNTLVGCEVIVCDNGGKYFLAPQLAQSANPVVMRRFAEVLTKAVEELGPWLDDMRQRTGTPSAIPSKRADLGEIWREEYKKIEEAIGALVVAAKGLEARLAASHDIGAPMPPEVGSPHHNH